MCSVPPGLIARPSTGNVTSGRRIARIVRIDCPRLHGVLQGDVRRRGAAVRELAHRTPSLREVGASRRHRDIDSLASSLIAGDRHALEQLDGQHLIAAFTRQTIVPDS
jgi:hypothetical protein